MERRRTRTVKSRLNTSGTNPFPFTLANTSSTISSRESWRERFASLEDKLLYMYSNQISTDVILVAEEANEKLEINVHKNVLVANSESFEAFFERWTIEEKDGKKILPFDKDSATFSIIKIFVRCLYKNDYQPNSVQECIQLVEIARKYLCSNLVDNFVKYLKSKMILENVIELYQTAKQLDLTDLLQNSLEFIGNNIEKIITNPTLFNELTENEVNEILANDSIFIEELKLFKALLNWAKHNCIMNDKEPNINNIKDIIKDSYKLIRYPLFSLEGFAKYVVPERILSIEQEHQVYTYLSLTTFANKSREEKENIKSELSMDFSIDKRLYSTNMFPGKVTANIPVMSTKFSQSFKVNRNIKIHEFKFFVGASSFKEFALADGEVILSYEIDLNFYTIEGLMNTQTICRKIFKNLKPNNTNHISVHLENNGDIPTIRSGTTYVVNYSISCVTSSSTRESETKLANCIVSHEMLPYPSINMNSTISTTSCILFSYTCSTLPKDSFYLTQIKFMPVPGLLGPKCFNPLSVPYTD